MNKIKIISKSDLQNAIIETVENGIVYFKNNKGELHNPSDYAVIYPDGKKEVWYNGKQLDNIQELEKIARKNFIENVNKKIKGSVIW